ncbi:uncharacterized protein LOC141679387 [Apium graveolens]|uniref:uncharacterized protein LOC141679387 n=1 Tax=Apium graveolens TaxID=4045 RepID=UPI003D78EA08
MDGENGNSQNNNENQNNNGNQGNNDEGGNIFDQLGKTLVVLVNQQSKPNIVSQFKRLNRPIFDGATDPAVVEMWIKEMEKAFGLFGSNEQQKVTLSVYQFQGSAYDWWLMEKRKNETTANLEENPEPLSAERENFIRLQQGGRTVIEYEAQFAKLAKFASTLVADESSRARRLEEGLQSDIRNSVASFELQTYEAVLNKALVIERGLVESEKTTGRWNKRRFTQTSGQSFQGGPLKKSHVYDNIGGQGDQERCSRCDKNHPDKVYHRNTGAYFHCGEVGHKISNCPHNPPPPQRKEADNKMGKGRVFQLTGNDNYRN